MGEEVAKAEDELVAEGLFRLIIPDDEEADACAACRVCDEHEEVDGLFRLMTPDDGEGVASAAWVGDPAYDVPTEVDGLFSMIIAGDGEAIAFAVWDEDPVGDKSKVDVKANDVQSPDGQADVGSAAESDAESVGNEPLDVAVAVALLLPLCLAEAEGVEDSVLVDVEFDEPLPLPTPGSDVISVN